jgi:DNA polymerase-3 subunit alpha
MTTAPKKFVGLHAHTTVGSPLDAIGYPDEHFAYAFDGGADAMAITDHGNMNSFAHADFAVKAMQKAGKQFKHISGCEFYYHPSLEMWREDIEEARRLKEENKEAKKLAKQQAKQMSAELADKVSADLGLDDSDDQNEGTVIENEAETKDPSKWFNPVNRRHHLVVLAKSSKGLENLFALVSKGYKDGFYRFPRIDRKLLKEHGEDLIVLSACIGGPFAYDTFYELRDYPKERLNATLLDDQRILDKVLARLENTYDGLCDAVGRENVFPEIQFNKLSEQHLVNRALIELSKKTGAKLVVTADSHYSNKDFWQARELYKLLGRLKFGEIDPSMLPKNIEDLKCELYPKNAEQIWESYKKYTEGFNFYDDELVKDAIERTWFIAHEMIGTAVADRTVKLPNYVVPAGQKPISALVEALKKRLIEKGLADKPEYMERLKKELGLIKEKKYEKYFLTMKEIFDEASQYVLVGPGRGSACASLVNYLLGITQIDPLKYPDLVFERFINKQRAEPPDIDSDLSDRDLVINKLSEKFGKENVVPISTYSMFQLKSLTKDISKFYGIPFTEATEGVSSVEQDVRDAIMGAADDKNLFVLTLDDAVKHSKKYRDYLEKYPEVHKHIQVLYKQVRSLGRHAGGVLISENLVNKMPLITVKGDLQTPWVEGVNIKHLNEYGFLKFDLLGLETLRIVELCIRNILRAEGQQNVAFLDIKKWFDEKLHPDVLDFNDQEVYKNVYHRGRFCATFQFTGQGAQRFIKKFKPVNLRDIAIATSIYRPGPLAAKVDALYLKAKEDPEEQRKKEHPAVWKALESTHGCIIFQESLLKLAVDVAGFNPEESEKVRKTILKQSIAAKADNKEKREGKMRSDFIAGCMKTSGLTEFEGAELWDKILFFCGYGFNASHAFAYAIDSYYCAYLQTHFEAEWCAAYLESVSSSADKLANAISEVKALGYTIGKLDINTSTDGWTALKGQKVVVPSFLSCKGVGRTAIEEIVEKRPYKDVYDLLWNEDGSWKHSKFNKRSFENLVKVGAFGSLDIVGPGKIFTSYKQMHEVMVEHMDELKKSPKKDPEYGQRRFAELVSDTKDIEDWSRTEKLAMVQDLLGNYDINLVISAEQQGFLANKGVTPVDEWNGKNLYWAVVTEVQLKKTKNGKEYILAKVMGNTNKLYKVFMWGCKDIQAVPINTAYIAEFDRSDFGFSTNQWKLRKIEEPTRRVTTEDDAAEE